MKWLIIGDLHGEFKAFNYALKHKKIGYDAIIQLGDFGFWKDSLQRSKKKFPQMCRKPIFFVRGNHEEYSRYKRGKERGPFFNDYEGIIVPRYFERCKHIPIFINDEVVEIGGIKVLGVGGAVSTDRALRVLGQSWWRAEEVNGENVETIIGKGSKTDIIISHDGPTQFFERSEYKNRFSIRAGDKHLGHLYDNIKPLYWFFGHYHELMEWSDPDSGTRFVCFPTWDRGFGIFDTELMELRKHIWF